MFIQMLECYHGSHSQSHNTLFIQRDDVAQHQLLVVGVEMIRFFSVLTFKDGKIISTFLQHSSFNVLWIFYFSSRKYESQTSESS